MSLLSDDGTIEECLDQLTQTIGDLDRFAPTVLAVALRVHLEALLRTLLESHFCTGAEVRVFLRELERDVLQLDSR